MTPIRSALIFSLLANLSSAQTFLNGSFETNTAGSSDQINLSNTSFNGMMSDVFAFGTTGNMDIIQSASWGGSGAQHCKWYVALTQGGTDAITLKLSAPLASGTTYTISFWDRKDASFTTTSIEIGLSTTNNSFGSLIYTAPGPVINTWTQRTFTFIAPSNGDYVSVRQAGSPSTSPWIHVDNFALNNSGGLNIAASANPICVGASAVFTVTGANSFTWSPSGSLSSANGSVVTANPGTTTTYTVDGSNGSCIYTTSITLNVIPQVSVVITPTNSICVGESVTLTATGSASYSWTPSTGLNSTTASAVSASPGSSTNYTVTGVTGSCTSIASTSILVKAVPQLSVTGSPTLVCQNDKPKLTVSGASNYTWTPGGIHTSTIYVNTLNTGTVFYTAVGQNTNGCTASKIFTLSIQLCKDLGEVVKREFDLYPNPSSGLINITSEQDLVLRLFSSLGALVMEVNISGTNRTLQIGPLESGVYFVADNSSAILKKVVIIK